MALDIYIKSTDLVNGVETTTFKKLSDMSDEFRDDLGVSQGGNICLSWATIPNPFLGIAMGTEYVVTAQFVFKGIDELGTPTFIKMLIASSDGDPAISVRVYDVTNAQEICKKTGLTSTSMAIVDMGTLSNLPTGEAIFEVQAKRASGGAVIIHQASLHIEF